MSYNLSFEDITSRMLDNISDEFDKRETSLIYQAIAMNVPEYINIASELELIENEAFPDTCNRRNLIRKGQERNISPIPSQVGIVKAEFNVPIKLEDRFFCEQRVYMITELLEEPEEGTPESDRKYIYRMVTEEVGHIERIGDLIPIQDIDGLKTAKILGIIEDGRDEEETERFRERYNFSLDYQSFGGNKADYREKIMMMDNIGGVKVFRRKEGEENIKIYILGTDYVGAPEETVKAVQEYIDPSQNGDGLGLAPIDHIVKVYPAGSEKISIKTKVKIRDQVDITEDIEHAIKFYLYDLNQTWSYAEDSTIVRIAHIESLILNIDGVIDVENTTINGVTSNLEVESTKVPVLGEVVADIW